jgi:hypothetical protein
MEYWTAHASDDVNRHRFDADQDPDPSFHFDDDPDPDPTPNFTHVGKSGNIFLTFKITAVPVFIVLSFTSTS